MGVGPGRPLVVATDVESTGGPEWVISIYGHHHWVGRVYRGQDMTVRYDGLARQWVVRDQTGEVAWRFEARELSREAILGLAVSRK